MSVLWSDRDHSTCVYPVAGIGRHTLICAAPSAGFYCAKHFDVMAESVRHAANLSYAAKKLARAK